MEENLKKLDNCALCFKRKIGSDGKSHDNMYVILPNGKSIQVKQCFYNTNELNALKMICGVNVPQKDGQEDKDKVPPKNASKEKKTSK